MLATILAQIHPAPSLGSLASAIAISEEALTLCANRTKLVGVARCVGHACALISGVSEQELASVFPRAFSGTATRTSTCSSSSRSSSRSRSRSESRSRSRSNSRSSVKINNRATNCAGAWQFLAVTAAKHAINAMEVRILFCFVHCGCCSMCNNEPPCRRCYGLMRTDSEPASSAAGRGGEPGGSRPRPCAEACAEAGW